MLVDLVLTLGLIALYAGMVLASICILSRIPFVRKAVEGFGRWFDSINDKLDEAMGYYETWRQ